MYAADLAITGFAADGTNLLVTYDVLAGDATAFNVGIYRSSDGASLDAQLGEVRLTEPSRLNQGYGHSIAVALSFDDIETDYYLIAKLDSGAEISEPTETNNVSLFSGGVFRASGNIIHVHGSAAADAVNISAPGAIDVVFGSTTYSFAASGVSEIHVRLHDGGDALTTNAAVDKAVWAFGGNGADTLTGAYGGDIIIGGEGNDQISGGGGSDVLRGAGGDDTIDGGEGNDIEYGGAGADILIGGYGDDSLFGDDGADSLFGGFGNDIVYGGAGDDAAYGGYGGGGYGGGGYGGYGDDLIDGGAGVDLIFANVGDQVSDRPVFAWFDVVYIGENEWEVKGRVIDDSDLTGRTVSISGAISTTSQLDSAGNFCKVVSAPSGITGSVVAQFTDEEQLAAPTITILI